MPSDLIDAALNDGTRDALEIICKTEQYWKERSQLTAAAEPPPQVRAHARTHTEREREGGREGGGRGSRAISAYWVFIIGQHILEHKTAIVTSTIHDEIISHD